MRDVSMYGFAGRSRLPANQCRRKAVILDVDGTLCDVSGALDELFGPGGKNFGAFHAASANCPPYPETLDYAKQHFDKGYVLLIITGRMQSWREQTAAWLREHLRLPHDGPFMRADGDTRPSSQVKREIYNYLSHHYDIRCAADDDPDVCQMWEDLGLAVWTAPGRAGWVA